MSLLPVYCVVYGVAMIFTMHGAQAPAWLIGTQFAAFGVGWAMMDKVERDAMRVADDAIDLCRKMERALRAKQGIIHRYEEEA